MCQSCKVAPSGVMGRQRCAATIQPTLRRRGRSGFTEADPPRGIPLVCRASPLPAAVSSLGFRSIRSESELPPVLRGASKLIEVRTRCQKLPGLPGDSQLPSNWSKARSTPFARVAALRTSHFAMVPMPEPRSLPMCFRRRNRGRPTCACANGRGMCRSAMAATRSSSKDVSGNHRDRLPRPGNACIFRCSWIGSQLQPDPPGSHSPSIRGG